MPTRRLIATAALLAAAGLGAPAHAQQNIRLTAAAGHPPVFLWVKLVDEFFIREVDKRLAAAGKHKIEWTRAWGGTLIKLGAESKGIGDGVADLGFVSTIFEAAKFPTQNVSYYAPFGTDDIGVVTQVVNELQGRIPAMGQAWSKNNLVYLGGAALDAYHIWTSFPLKSVDDLKGRKITAPGPAANWIKGTGAVAVAGNLNTYYEDIKSGVSNGVITFATGAWGAKVHEVAPYITKVNFGAQYAGARGGALHHQGQLRRPVRRRAGDQQGALRQAAARGAEGDARSRRRVQPALCRRPGADRRRAAEEGRGSRRQAERAAGGRAQALGRHAAADRQDLCRRPAGQGAAGRPGAARLHGRAEEGRRAAGARLGGEVRLPAESPAAPSPRRGDAASGRGDPDHGGRWHGRLRGRSNPAGGASRALGRRRGLQTTYASSACPACANSYEI